MLAQRGACWRRKVVSEPMSGIYPLVDHAIRVRERWLMVVKVMVGASGMVLSRKGGCGGGGRIASGRLAGSLSSTPLPSRGGW